MYPVILILLKNHFYPAIKIYLLNAMLLKNQFSNTSKE